MQAFSYFTFILVLIPLTNKLSQIKSKLNFQTRIQVSFKVNLFWRSAFNKLKIVSKLLKKYIYPMFYHLSVGFKFRRCY